MKDNIVNGTQLMSDAKFFEAYSRFDEDKQRYETWDEAVDRVMDMHKRKYVNKMSTVLEEYFKKAENLYKSKRILGAQRALQFGGKQLEANNLKLYNCLERSTRFITDKGIKSFEDFEDGDEIVVLTHTGKWKNAVVRSYGEQSLDEITFNTVVKSKFRERKVRATSNHRWLLKDGSVTTSLEVGDTLRSIRGKQADFNYDSATPFEKLYWCYGYTFGDGTITHSGNGSYSLVRLCNRGGKVSKEYLPRFKEMGFKTSDVLGIAGDYFAYTGSYLKTTPNMDIDSVELLTAFISGYLNADGSRNTNGVNASGENEYTLIQTTGKENIDFIRSMFPTAGVFILGEEDFTGQVTNYAPQGRKETRRFHIRNGIDKLCSWKVQNIEKNVAVETVWCLEVEDDHSFVLEGGIITGNCASGHLDRPEFFGEFMELLLSGCGVGFSVQKQHISQLPALAPRKKAIKKFVVPDSIEGWAQAFDVLFSSFFVNGGKHPEYQGHPVLLDLHDIRPKGAMISGGFKAPGPEPLRKALDFVEKILTTVANEKRQLKSIEAYDACMHMADAVISGGVRRSATVVMFSKDDEDMIKAKTGDWFVSNPQRGRSNNSAMLLRNETSSEEFQEIMKSVEHSGEPGFIWTDNLEFTFNP